MNVLTILRSKRIEDQDSAEGCEWCLQEWSLIGHNGPIGRWKKQSFECSFRSKVS